MNSEWAVETKALTLDYGNGEEVLTGVDLRVPRGSVYGLLGRNGAGKTTLIRGIMGLYRARSGSIRVFGRPTYPMPLEVKQRIGYLSQDQKMFSWMTLADLAAFSAPFYPSWDGGYFDELVVNLALPLRRPMGHLSRGEQQKAGLLLALAPRPDLLVLDEPAANLDTVLRREFLESILDLLTREGITVLISSHILTDVERIADWIGILDEGRIRLAAPLESLKESVKKLRIQFPGEAPADLEVPGAIRVRRRGREVLVTVQDYAPALPERIRARYGVGVEVQDVDLEDLFIEYLS